jgi:hypothetical protein
MCIGEFVVREQKHYFPKKEYTNEQPQTKRTFAAAICVFAYPFASYRIHSLNSNDLLSTNKSPHYAIN